MCKKVIDELELGIRFIPDDCLTADICLYAIKKDEASYEFISHELNTIEFLMRAYSVNPKVEKYMQL